MASTKQHNKLTLLDVLRGFIGLPPSTRIHLNKPKVAQPGARFASKAEPGKHTGKEIFGQRKNCSSYTNR
jgi:hypothetical protein